MLAVPSPRIMVVKILRDVSQLEDIASSWADLAATRRSPLLQPDWYISCARAFCEPGRLRVLAVVDGEHVAAVAPLMSVRERGSESLEILGARVLYEPTGLLFASEGALADLVDAMLSMKRPIAFGRLGTDAPEWRPLGRLIRRRALLLSRLDAGAPWLSIDGRWSDFECQMKPRRRADLRRARRRAEAAGEVTFEFLSPGPDEARQRVADFADIELLSWKARAGTPLRSDPRLMRFFQLYATEAARGGRLRVAFMRIDQQSIAAQIAVEFDGRYWVLKTGYDESWRRTSPGVQLMHETIRLAFEAGLSSFEFLGNAEPWITMWTDRVHPTVRAHAYPYTYRGAASLLRDTCRFAAKRLDDRRIGAGTPEGSWHVRQR